MDEKQEHELTMILLSLGLKANQIILILDKIETEIERNKRTKIIEK